METDIETVRKAGERVGGRVRLPVDGNHGLTTRDAVLLSRACRDVRFAFEQPCNTIEGIA